jgi:hypothetical protein
MMVDLSFANSFVTHHYVLIIGWLFVLGLTVIFLSGDSQVSVACGSDKRGTNRNE